MSILNNDSICLFFPLLLARVFLYNIINYSYKYAPKHFLLLKITKSLVHICCVVSLNISQC
uniref:Uncharacterized protein n=1 Tax=Lepeophtheirus salmonis TaxID=72036 RepID=A0A0K2VCA7_LEPSM